MSNQSPYGALRQYQNAATVAAVSADIPPHKLIDMLLTGALDRLNMAKGCIVAGETQHKLQLFASAIAIVEHLRVCLDHQAGGEIAKNLDALYDYIGRRLLKANLDNDTAIADEAIELLKIIKAAWDEVPGPPRLQH